MIRGEKVGLRAVEEGDLKILRDWRNRPEFRRNFREVRELNMENQAKWYAALHTPQQQMINYMFTIVDLKTSEPIGAAGILYINWLIRSGDFSFYIGKDGLYIDNEGYAEEAAKLLINYAANNLNLHKIWMELYEFDQAKIDFFTRIFGFEIDGKLRDNCFEDGKYWDSYIISLIL